MPVGDLSVLTFHYRSKHADSRTDHVIELHNQTRLLHEIIEVLNRTPGNQYPSETAAVASTADSSYPTPKLGSTQLSGLRPEHFLRTLLGQM